MGKFRTRETSARETLSREGVTYQGPRGSHREGDRQRGVGEGQRCVKTNIFLRSLHESWKRKAKGVRRRKINVTGRRGPKRGLIR